MIYEGSRYENSQLVPVPTSAGTLVKAIYPHDRFALGFEFFEYVTSSGDRLDVLAQRFYNDPERWWLIVQANPDVIYFPQDPLSAGLTLRIPDDVISAW